MTGFAKRRPLAFSVIVVLAALTGIKVADAALTMLGVPALGARVLVESLLCVYVALMLSRLKWWHVAGFSRATIRQRWLAWLPLLLLPIIVLAGSGIKSGSVASVASVTVFTLMVGFAEEGLLRGIVLHALLPQGTVRAAVLSSAIFGAGHLVNLWQGAAPSATIVQVVFATFLGIAYSGARLYSGTIWPAIALHALTDWLSLAGRGFAVSTPRAVTLSQAIAPIALTGLCALYGWWLLRRARALHVVM